MCSKRAKWKRGSERLVKTLPEKKLVPCQSVTKLTSSPTCIYLPRMWAQTSENKIPRMQVAFWRPALCWPNAMHQELAVGLRRQEARSIESRTWKNQTWKYLKPGRSVLDHGAECPSVAPNPGWAATWYLSILAKYFLIPHINSKGEKRICFDDQPPTNPPTGHQMSRQGLAKMPILGQIWTFLGQKS